MFRNLSSSVRKPSIGVTSVSSSIEGKETIGDALRKARKELIAKRVCLGLLLAVVLALIVYLIMIGFFSELIDASFALIDRPWILILRKDRLLTVCMMRS